MATSIQQHFGQASVDELQRVVSLVEEGRSATLQSRTYSSSFAEVLPPSAAFVLAGVVHHEFSTSGAFTAETVAFANACAAVKALLSGPKGATPGLWSDSTVVSFGQRLLQAPRCLLADAGGKDLAALHFLGKVLYKKMSMSEVAHELRHEVEGRKCLEAFRTSATLGAVLMYASIYSWWDDVVDWLKGAVQWVKDAYNQFGEWATKQASALVDAVFSKFKAATEILEQIPGVGLVVAGIYAVAGKSDEALAALAINLNATVTVIASAVGFAIGNVPGSMLGGALGKAAGLVIQKAISTLIKDPTLKAEVGDISATSFIANVALSAIGAAAGDIGSVLAKEAGMATIATLVASQTLTTLLSRLPAYFAKPTE